MSQKVYQVTANIILNGDGFVKANSLTEAKEKYEMFLRHEVSGLSLVEIDVAEVMGHKNKNFDRDSKPSDAEFDESDCVTRSYLS